MAFRRTPFAHHSLGGTMEALLHELWLLGGSAVIISTDLRVRLAWPADERAA